MHAPSLRGFFLAPFLAIFTMAYCASGQSPQEPVKEDCWVPISVTVFAHQFTELRWSHEGRLYRAYSRTDWNLFAGLGSIETEERVYGYVLGIGNETSLPVIANLPLLEGTYVLGADSQETPADPEALKIMNDFHSYYLLHKAALSQAYVAREAARLAHEQWLIENPPTTEPPPNRWGERTVYVDEQAQ